MANKTLTIVVAAVVVIAAAVAVYAILYDDDDSDVNIFQVDGLGLMIYGNANFDLTIDEEDMAIVQAIIDEEITDWREEYPLADVNCDGEIDESDIALLQQIIDREECTLYVACLDSDGNSTYVSVSYPLNNIAVIGSNAINAVLYADAGGNVVAYTSPPSSYDNAYSTLSGTNVVSQMVYLDVDAFTSVDSVTPIDAVFIDAQYSWSVTETGFSSFEASQIPYLVYAVAGSEMQVSATLTIGFLCGEETETTSLDFVESTLSVFDYISETLGDMSDDEKSVFMTFAITATTICQNDHPNQYIGIQAGGIPYYQTNSEFASLYPGTSTGTTASDALAEFRDADAYVLIASVDYGSDPYEIVVGYMEPTSGNDPEEFFYDAIENWYFINNLLPAAVKTAYMAEILYPELFAGYGDQVAQAFIDAGYGPLAGQTVENLVPVLSYQDYVDAKAAGY